jgi:hypothetical protein
LLTGSHDCVDRVVLNAYYPLGHNPGGFRTWWRRLHDGSDGQLDDTHLMRMAGRFARRVKGWAKANGIPVIYCTAGERKHEIAEEYLEAHSPGTGVFLILAAKAPASVWKVNRPRGAITSLEKKTEYVYHYSFHIMDPAWGHMVVKMSGHPPWPAQVILNGHEYVAVTAQSWDRLHEGGQLLYCNRGSAGPCPGRRCLVAACGHRAPGPGMRAVDLHRLPVLRPGHQRAAAQRVPLRLLGLPGRIQPQPAVPIGQADGRPVQPGAGPHPVPAGHPGTADHLRAEDPAAPQPGSRPARAGCVLVNEDAHHTASCAGS